jgi:hypothetical protein
MAWKCNRALTDSGFVQHGISDIGLQRHRHALGYTVAAALLTDASP